ncbi:MAG: aldehyde dehydrogenase family protein [Planctomycetota bacterium]
MQLPQHSDLSWVRSFRRAIVRDLDRFYELTEEELGRDRFETLTADVVPLLAACKWTERHAARILRPRRTVGHSIWQIGQRHRVNRVPLGAVGIIATWNYPIQLLGIQLIHAIAAGNRVTVKPSERSPRTQEHLLGLAREAGLSEQRLAWTEPTREAGEALIKAGGLDHVVFTGSTQVGRQIASELAKTLTPSTLELSGCDSALVMGDADPSLAAASIAFALTLNAGQTCMAPRRVIVHADLHDAFVERLAEEILLQEPRVVMDAAEQKRADDLVERAVAQGARRLDTIDPGVACVLTGCPIDAQIAAGQHFTPTLAVIRAHSDESVLASHRRFPQHLAVSVFTSSPRERRAEVADFRATVVTFNDCVVPTGHPGLSIGGIGPSGWGRSRGAEGLLAMTRPVYVTTTPRRIRIPTDPPTLRVRSALDGFVRRRYG